MLFHTLSKGHKLIKRIYMKNTKLQNVHIEYICLLFCKWLMSRIDLSSSCLYTGTEVEILYTYIFLLLLLLSILNMKIMVSFTISKETNRKQIFDKQQNLKRKRCIKLIVFYDD